MLSCLIVLCEEFSMCHHARACFDSAPLLNYTRWRRIWMGPVNGPSMVRFSRCLGCALSAKGRSPISAAPVPQRRAPLYFSISSAAPRGGSRLRHGFRRIG